MDIDFDTPVDFSGISAAKIEAMPLRTGAAAPDAIAMWLADMDFRAPQCVTDAVQAAAAAGFLGYYGKTDNWARALTDWLANRHSWEVDRDWLFPAPGILFGLSLVMQNYSRPGDHVVLFSPVYHEFSVIIEASDRRVHFQPMKLEQGRMRIDLEGLARDLPDTTRVVVLCSPHNPGGRVWTKEELVEVAEFCADRDLILVSDEIHADIVYPGARHIPTAAAAPHAASNIVTLAGATKAFNIAGTKVGAIIVQDPTIREALKRGLRGSGTGSPNRFGMVATEAAWREGGPWLDRLLLYLRKNRDRFADGIVRAIPGARPMAMEATYLAWVDFSGLDLPLEEIRRRIEKDARIGISPGPQFGPGGESAIRFNIATHRSRLEEALSRLEQAFGDLR